MKRRDFLVSMAMFATAMRRALAQQLAKMKRVASMHPTTKTEDQRIGSSDPIFTFILEEMKRLGYVEGINFVLDRYSAEGQYDQNPELARNVVATRPDVILSISNPVTSALLSETRTIPIVAWTGDPISSGYVTNLARPGGNITGVGSIVDAGAMMGKRLQLLGEAVGKLSNVRSLTVVSALDAKTKASLEAAAEKLKITTFQFQQLQSPVDETEYRRAFEAMRRDHVDAVSIGPDAENYTHRVLLGQLAREYHLPAICWFGDSVEAGALMAYAHDIKAEVQRFGVQIVEILNGGNPAEMPFFREIHWKLVINLKAAKELGLEVPAGLVAQADRVIE